MLVLTVRSLLRRPEEAFGCPLALFIPLRQRDLLVSTESPPQPSRRHCELILRNDARQVAKVILWLVPPHGFAAFSSCPSVK